MLFKFFVPPFIDVLYTDRSAAAHPDRSCTDHVLHKLRRAFSFCVSGTDKGQVDDNAGCAIVIIIIIIDGGSW
jgi:hypothetical protein